MNRLFTVVQARRGLAILVTVVAAGLLAPTASYATGVTVTDLDNGATATGLAQALTGGGVTVSNVTYTGANRAAGSFSGGSSSINFDTGIVLDSGNVQTYGGGTPDDPCSQGVEGPNNCFEGGTDGSTNSTSMLTPGDGALDALLPPGQASEDAAVLEFDFVPQQSTLEFQYVFSSEEYNDYANTEFNDIFAFFVNGTNCALVPGTTDPVSVNNINNGNPFGDTAAHHPELFRDNVRPNPTIESQMDGLTTVLTCTANVNAGVTNHMKLAIADVGDDAYDSAVFMAAGSLISGGRALNVSKTGSGSGSVTSSPAGIDCGATCAASYTSGTVVTLTATPAAGSSFSGWSGDCSGSGTCTVTMDQARNVTATFTLQTHTLTVTRAGTGSGSVTSAPAGISCSPTCSASYNHGTAVTLTATAAAGSTFAGWSGDCTGTGTCALTMNGDHGVTATFTLNVVTPPPIGIGGPGSVDTDGLFCGAQHRGKCTGLKVKGVFDRPGNASWTFDAYNPTPGNRGGQAAAAAKKVRLGQIKRVVKKAGTITVVFKLKKGAKTAKLYKQVKKAKLKSILVTLTFTSLTGEKSTKTKVVKLKG